MSYCKKHNEVYGIHCTECLNDKNEGKAYPTPCPKDQPEGQDMPNWLIKWRSEWLHKMECQGVDPKVREGFEDEIEWLYGRISEEILPTTFPKLPQHKGPDALPEDVKTHLDGKMRPFHNRLSYRAGAIDLWEYLQSPETLQMASEAGMSQEDFDRQTRQIVKEEIEWDSLRLIGRVRERHKELIEKGWDWRSFYNGWLEGRADMWAQNKGLAYPNELPEQGEIPEEIDPLQILRDFGGTIHEESYSISIDTEDAKLAMREYARLIHPIPTALEQEEELLMELEFKNAGDLMILRCPDEDDEFTVIVKNKGARHSMVYVLNLDEAKQIASFLSRHCNNSRDVIEASDRELLLHVPPGGFDLKAYCKEETKNLAGRDKDFFYMGAGAVYHKMQEEITQIKKERDILIGNDKRQEEKILAQREEIQDYRKALEEWCEFDPRIHSLSGFAQETKELLSKYPRVRREENSIII